MRRNIIAHSSHHVTSNTTRRPPLERPSLSMKIKMQLSPFHLFWSRSLVSVIQTQSNSTPHHHAPVAAQKAPLGLGDDESGEALSERLAMLIRRVLGESWCAGGLQECGFANVALDVLGLFVLSQHVSVYRLEDVSQSE